MIESAGHGATDQHRPESNDDAWDPLTPGPPSSPAADGLLRVLGALTPARFGALPRGMLAGVVGKRLLARVVGPERAERLHADLMAAIPCVTTESNAALDRLAATVRANPQLRAAYDQEVQACVAERLRGSAAGRALLAEIDGYLRAYGFREMSIFSVGLPFLRERPEIVHGLIKGLARRGPDADAAEPAARRAAARVELTGIRGPRGLIARVILRLVDAERRATAFREDSHYQIVMVFAVVRRVVLELGRRLVARGVLDAADDIMYLEPHEVRELAPQLARQTVSRRKAARAAALDHYTIVPAALLAPPERGDTVRGAPASPGTAVGPVRVVGGEAQFAALRPGEVLVCPYTNPTWTPLFALAAAVVVDVADNGSPSRGWPRVDRADR